MKELTYIKDGIVYAQEFLLNGPVKVINGTWFADNFVVHTEFKIENNIVYALGFKRLIEE